MPTFQFTSPRTGSTYNVDFDNDPNDADLEEARADLDMREQQTGQNLFQATTGEVARSALSVPKGIVGGAGAVASLIPGAEDNFLQRGAESFQQAYEDVIPVDPALQESFPVKAASAVGQGAGMLGATYLTGGLGPAVARAAGLGTAGLLGAEQGGERAEQYAITDPWERAAMVLGSAAIEGVTEAGGGLGSKNFTEALLGQMKSATRPGTAITRALKTVGSEFGEEVVAGQGGDWLTKGIVEEDPNRPGFALNGAALPPDTFTMENLYNRLEEGALGAIGGAVFAGAEALGSQTPVNEALSLRMQARTVLDELQAKETLTPEEQAQLFQMEADDQNLGAWLERQGMDAVRPALDQIINDPEANETERTEAVQYASLIDNLAAVEAAPDVAPEELQAAREAVSNHPLNGTVNRLAKTRQDQSLKGAWEDRKAALQKQVQDAKRRQEQAEQLQSGQPIPQENVNDVVLAPLKETIQETVQELAKLDPKTAASFAEVFKETPADPTIQAQEIIQPTNETPTAVPQQQTGQANAPQQMPVAEPSQGGITGGTGVSGQAPTAAPQLTAAPIKNSRPVELNVITKSGLAKETVEASPEVREILVKQKVLYSKLLKCLNI